MSTPRQRMIRRANQLMRQARILRERADREYPEPPVGAHYTTPADLKAIDPACGTGDFIAHIVGNPPLVRTGQGTSTHDYNGEPI